jgi:hypothetical protein
MGHRNDAERARHLGLKSQKKRPGFNDAWPDLSSGAALGILFEKPSNQPLTAQSVPQPLKLYFQRMALLPKVWLHFVPPPS